MKAYWDSLTKEQQGELAGKVGSTPGYLRLVFNGYKKASFVLAKKLEQCTSGAITKSDLRPDINTRLEQSARIIQRTPDEVLPALVLAATWFDNAARDADIIRRNAITHPGFVPVIPLKVPVQ